MSALSVQPPFPTFQDVDGQPLEDGYIWIGTANLDPQTNPITVYWDAGLTIPAAQPIRTLGGYPSNSGTPGRLYVNVSTSYSFRIQNKNGSLVYSAPTATERQIAENISYTPGANSLLTATNVQAALDQVSDDEDGSLYVGFLQAGTGAVARTAQSKMRDIIDARDFGITQDGVTDNTSALTALMSSLSSSGFRGVINIPYGTKFNVATVWASVPVGVILQDNSSINWGQPPSYKNKFLITYSGDNVSDDTQEIIASPHHPALMLLNMGTDSSAAASSRYATILHGVGKDYAGDPILGWLWQFAKDPAATQWRVSLRMQTPYEVAVANPQPWAASTVYAANAYCVSDGGKIYTTSAGGTSGSTAPTGTGSSINDGGVLWDYVQAALNIDSTRFEWFQDGKSGQFAPAGGVARYGQSAGSKSWYFEIDDATGTITLRDVNRLLNIFSVSDAAGLEIGTATSPIRLPITGTGPNAPITGAGRVENGGATNMSTMVPPAGRTKMIVSLRFDNSNTTVVHGTGTNNLTLKGGVNVTPSFGQFITFEYDYTFTARWIEVSRSF